MSYSYREWKMSGMVVKRFFTCPKCNVEALIDEDQFRGRVSLLCDCGFHETINLAEVCTDEG